MQPQHALLFGIAIGCAIMTVVFLALTVVRSTQSDSVTAKYDDRDVSLEWDTQLKALMLEHRFKTGRLSSNCTVTIGGVEVWVANHPFASFRPYPFPEVFPRRETVRLAAEKLVADMVFEKTGKEQQ